MRRRGVARYAPPHGPLPAEQRRRHANRAAGLRALP